MRSWDREPVRTSVSSFWYRHTTPGLPPLVHSAGEPTPSQPAGRWHRLGEGYAQYLSESPAGAWAELIRYFSIRSDTFAAEHRRDLWLVYVQESEIADLRSFEDWRSCGIDPEVAVGSHGPCRQLAEALRARGFRGVLSPSAALPDTLNLTLFGRRYERVVTSNPQVWNNPSPGLWLACQAAAAEASPPPRLIRETCFQSDPHRGYEAWRAGC